MFEKIKAKILFCKLLSRPDINKAYAMVGPEDSWYDTISKVHKSLYEIQKLPHEILEIKSSDGTLLRGVYYPAETKRDKTVIFIHGFRSHAEREWAFPGLFYHSIGFNVLIPYQRAYGLSEGDRITFGGLEGFDMINWAGEINKITPDSRILLHGLSMGGGIALQLADNEIPNVKAIIADAPTPSIESFYVNVARDVFKKNGDRVAEYAMNDFEKYTGFNARNFDTVKSSKDFVYPLLLSAGSNENYEEFFKTIKSNNPCSTDILILPGCNHCNGMYKQTEMYQTAIIKFIENYM